MAQTSVERTLGILLAKVEGIEKSIADGDKHRAVVHRRVDDVVDGLGELSTEVATMKADVIDSKKITDEVKQWKQRGPRRALRLGRGRLGHWRCRRGIRGLLVGSHYARHTRRLKDLCVSLH